MGVVSSRRIGGYAAVISCMLYGLHSGITTMQNSYSVTCLFDEAVSLCAQREISEYVQRYCAHISAEDIQSIKDHFKFIDSVVVRVINSSTKVVECTASKPFVVVQQDHVVLENGTIVPQCFFTPMVRASCKRLTLAPYVFASRVLSSQAIASLQRVSFEVCKQFDVVWHKATELYCIDKHNKNNVIIATDTVDAYQLVHNYSSILEKHALQRKKYAQCIDMRFENQLIVRQMDRGSYEEKVVC